MKRFNKLFITLTILIMAVACFAACSPTVEEGAKTCTLVIVGESGAETVITDNTDAVYVADWLEELNAEGDITLTFETGTYGMNIKTLNGIVVDGSTKYFAFYSDDADNTTTEWGTYSFGGATLGSCSFGQSLMPVKDGKTYVLQYTVWQA